MTLREQAIMSESEKNEFIQKIKNETPEYSDDQTNFLIESENLIRMRNKAKELGLSIV